MISSPPPQWSWRCRSCQRCPAQPSTRWSSCCWTPPTTLFSLLCSPLKVISLGDHLGPFETSRTGRSHFSPPLIHPFLAFDRTLTNSCPKTRKPSPRLHFWQFNIPEWWSHSGNRQAGILRHERKPGKPRRAIGRLDLPSFSRFGGTILQYKTRSNTTLLDRQLFPRIIKATPFPCPPCNG